MATGAEAEASPHEFPREVLGAASRRKRERAGEGKRKTEKKIECHPREVKRLFSGPPPPAQLSLILWLCAVYYVQCTESERETAVHIHVLDDLLPEEQFPALNPTDLFSQTEPCSAEAMEEGNYHPRPRRQRKNAWEKVGENPPFHQL